MYKNIISTQTFRFNFVLRIILLKTLNLILNAIMLSLTLVILDDSYWKIGILVYCLFYIL